jgi:ElaB/YqjD/DUF883 family membrane-anchored ribosome-binding protein
LRNEKRSLPLNSRLPKTSKELAMASALTRFREDFQDDMQDQIARLSREVSSLRKMVSRRGGAAYSDARDSAGDLYEDLWERVHDAMPDLRRGAQRARDSARDNPMVATAVAVGVIGLLALLMSRRS